MGGSFNPIHEGHVALALAAREQFQLDQVIFIPTGNPPHKREGLAPAIDRVQMTTAAVAPYKFFIPSCIETNRSGIIYSVDTFTILHEENPAASFYFIIGEDSLQQLSQWYNPDQLFTLCQFLVAPRDTLLGADETLRIRQALALRGAQFQDIVFTAMPYSSTAIRNAYGDGTPPIGVCPGIDMYIRLKGMYGTSPLIPNATPMVDKLYEALSPKRFAHTLGVSYAAWQLAALYALDEEKTVLAALLHDCAKCLPLAQMQALATSATPKEKVFLPDYDEETFHSGPLLHSLAGTILAMREYGITDPQVLHAIACHTTGSPGMTPMDMAVYLADKIEPGREPHPGLQAIRKAATQSLPQAMLLSLEGTVQYVRKKGKQVHPQAFHVIKWLHHMINTK